MSEEPNPYVAPHEQSETFLSTYDRSYLWMAFLLFQIVCYFAFACIAGFAALLLLVGQISGRPEEILLSLLILAASPVIGWFALMEIPSLRSPMPGRERLLARFAVLTTFVPFGLSVFWAYEYLAFGYFEANAVPAIFALGFAVIWFWVTMLRLRMAKRQ